MLGWLSSDGRWILVARGARTFAYGFLAVLLALYLDELGLDSVRIGLILTVAIAGSAAMTVFWSLTADRIGRRAAVAAMSILMAAGGLLFAFAQDGWWLVAGALTGTISATNSEVGAFISVEQAILPQTAPAERRTFLFAVYNAVGNLAGAVGALAAGLVPIIGTLGYTGADAYRPMFVAYAAIGVLNLALFARLSERVEIGGPKTGSAFSAALRETRSERLGPSTGRIARLAALFGLDAFAGGFVAQSIVAYWFFVRWGLGPEQLALVFFAANALAGVSFFAASWVASRIGLLNTMVFTHLPSNVLLVMVPFMPSPALAVMLFLARTSISQMDVPTRQSYTMAVVEPQERTAAAGITNVSRSLTTALSPPLAGIALGAGAFSVPFVIGGVLKIAYDLLVYASFRAIRPPEEVARGRTAARPAEQPRGN